MSLFHISEINHPQIPVPKEDIKLNKSTLINLREPAYYKDLHSSITLFDSKDGTSNPFEFTEGEDTLNIGSSPHVELRI